MRDVRFIGLGTRPYLHETFVFRLLEIDAETWQEWVDSCPHSLVMVHSPEGTYVEESGATLLVGQQCTPATVHAWNRHLHFENAKRRLTEAEKKAVAAAAHYQCARCHQTVTDYEIDHVEQYALRGNNARSNLQCLCPNCHREKTREDRRFGDALFEESRPPTRHPPHRTRPNVFAAYCLDS